MSLHGLKAIAYICNPNALGAKMQIYAGLHYMINKMIFYIKELDLASINCFYKSSTHTANSQVTIYNLVMHH